MHQKYKGNGHFWTRDFVLAITFCWNHFFKYRFHCWSAFWPHFETPPIFTIIVAIFVVAKMANFGHFSKLAILANVALAIIWSPIFSIWVSFRRAANLQITSENGIKKNDSNKKLWPKQNLESKNGHFPCIFGAFWTQKWDFRGTLSNWSSELILIFLESVEPGGWGQLAW